MNTMATSGFGNGALDSLAIATDHGRTRCVNAENPTGGKALQPPPPARSARHVRAALASRRSRRAIRSR